MMTLLALKVELLKGILSQVGFYTKKQTQWLSTNESKIELYLLPLKGMLRRGFLSHRLKRITFSELQAGG